MRYLFWYVCLELLIVGCVSFVRSQTTFTPGTCVALAQKQDVWESPQITRKVMLVGQYTYLTCEYTDDCKYLADLIASKADPKGFWLWNTIDLKKTPYYEVVPCDTLWTHNER